MGLTKTKPKKQRKVLTKKEKAAKRVSRMQKLIEYRKKLKRSRKANVVPIKKKRQQEAEEEIIDYATRQEDQFTTNAEVNILGILGLTGQQGASSDWEKKL